MRGTMNRLIPFSPWPFGPRHPQFYLCRCEACGFTQTCEVGDYEVISLDETEAKADDAFVQVKEVPKSCPKCGGRLKKTKIPSPVKY